MQEHPNATSIAEVDNNGYESGGDVAKALRTDGTQNGDRAGWESGYLGGGLFGLGDAIASLGCPRQRHLGALTVVDIG